MKGADDCRQASAAARPGRVATRALRAAALPPVARPRGSVAGAGTRDRPAPGPPPVRRPADRSPATRRSAATRARGAPPGRSRAGLDPARLHPEAQLQVPSLFSDPDVEIREEPGQA